MSFIEISHLRKSFGPTTVVHDFNMAIEKGEFISFLGPSGCGKTTVLRMIAGFETATSGVIKIDGRDVTGLSPAKRNVGMVFQAYALFPNMTVADNIAFGLKVADKPKAEIKARVGEMLEIIKLPHLAERYPYQLSAASSSVWRSPARSPCARRCCSSTSRCRRSTPRSASACARTSATCSASSASPRSS